MNRRRIATLSACAALFLAACGGDDVAVEDAPAASDPSDATGDDAGDVTRAIGDGKPFSVESIASSPREDTVSGLDMHRTGDVPPPAPQPLVDLEDVRSGGPPPDGIPPIDDPTFLLAGDVDFLAENAPVLAFELDGDTRAYPVEIMIWHEIVNDTVGGVPVTISYCPLCNSAVAYDRRLGDRVLDFGTSGLLYNSALVMYDRQTETLWSHFTGEGIIGELTGEDLTTFPLATVSWATWRDANPEGLVLSRDTGFTRDYGRNPYPGYDDVNGVPFLFQGEVDGRYTALTRVVGIEFDGRAVAIPLIELRETGVISGEIAGEPLVALWASGTASALDAAAVDAGTDVGATGVFVPVVDGIAISFSASGAGTFVDEETGSTWNILGEAVRGDLTGTKLDRYQHVDTFWFAWSTFRSDTVVLTG